MDPRPAAPRALPAVIVIAKKVGRLANRMLLFAHFIGTAEEHGLTILNPSFVPFGRYFPSTSRNLVARYPPRTATVRMPDLPREAIYVGVTAWADARRRRQEAGKDVGLIRLRRDQKVDIGSAEFLDAARSHRTLLIQDWFFRNEENCARHADAIRAYFRPHPRHLGRAHRVVERARAEGRLVIGVHIRRNDYRGFKDGRFFFTHAQYREVMQAALESHGTRDVAFLVCSDAPIPDAAFGGLQTFRGTGHELEDLYALAACDRLIGPPSTYNRWASFYGDVPLFQIEEPGARPEPGAFRIDRALSWNIAIPSPVR